MSGSIFRWTKDLGRWVPSVRIGKWSDYRSHRIAARADEILTLIEEIPDSTWAGIAVRLKETYGLKVAQTVCLYWNSLYFRPASHSTGADFPMKVSLFSPGLDCAQKFV